MIAKATKKNKKENKNLVGTRGRTFQGIITKHFPHRAVIELEQTVKVHKYERFARKKTKLHARIPINMKIHTGDIVKVRETRPLSKIVHFLIIEKVREAQQ